ncbi:putative phage tail protein [Roseobacter sp. AzwK-3b]|nr:putative phage tail protein [Roseobacter sp. AzwK-3b]
MVLDGRIGDGSLRAVRWNELESYINAVEQQFQAPVRELSGLIQDPALLFRNSGLSAPEIVDALPTTGNFAGRMVFLTLDSKLYRYTVDGAWTAAIPSTDVAGQIERAQIANGVFEDISSDISSAAATAQANAQAFAEQADGVLSTSLQANIDAAQQTLQASIDGVSADLSTNYFTSAQTNQAISAEFTVLQSSIDGVSADLSTNYLTAAETNQAISTSEQTLQSSIDGVSATVTTQAAVITSLENNASAGYLIRVGAGGAASILDLVAADGSAGPTSIAKVSADNIILDGTVTAAQIDAGTITGDKIAANTITGGLLATSGVITQTAQIGNGVIDTANIANGAIKNAQIENGAITSAKIQNGEITNAKIENGAITNAKIGGIIQSDNYSSTQGWRIDKNGSAIFNTLSVRSGIINGQALTSGTVDTAQIANNAIEAAKILANAVQTVKIEPDGVTGFRRLVTVGSVNNTTYLYTWNVNFPHSLIYYFSGRVYKNGSYPDSSYYLMEILIDGVVNQSMQVTGRSVASYHYIITGVYVPTGFHQVGLRYTAVNISGFQSNGAEVFIMGAAR